MTRQISAAILMGLLLFFSMVQSTVYILPQQQTYYYYPPTTYYYSPPPTFAEALGAGLGEGLAIGIENVMREQSQRRLIKERYAQEAALQEELMTIAHRQKLDAMAYEQELQEMAYEQQVQREEAQQRHALEIDEQKQQAKKELLTFILAVCGLITFVALISWHKLKKIIVKIHKKLFKPSR